MFLNICLYNLWTSSCARMSPAPSLRDVNIDMCAVQVCVCLCSTCLRVFVLLAYGRVCAGIEEALSVMFREVALTGDRALSRKHGNTEKNSDTHLQLWLRQRKNENPGQMWRKY